ncbi:MAG: SRPBCC domain-containing protein [Rubricoccaceae bacterium]|nr:SRPBCC domain-containing protein [Rubricoccaceae bacterium]
MSLPAVEKELSLHLRPREAFTRFTVGIGKWWPLHVQAVSKETVADAFVEPEVGGMIGEIDRHGQKEPWGKVLEWDEGKMLAATWHPGRSASTAQRLVVSFEEDRNGSLLRLHHSDWDKHPDNREAARKDYETGWDFVLGCFTSWLAREEADEEDPERHGGSPGS